MSTLESTVSPAAVDAGNAAVFTSEAERIAAVNRILGARRLAASPLARCLGPLLLALDWFGAPRTLVANLGDDERPMNVGHLRELLRGIGFRVRRLSWGGWAGGVDVLPIGSVVVSGDAARVYLGRRDGSDWWHDGARVATRPVPAAGATLLLVTRDADFKPIDAPQPGWLMRLLFRTRRELTGVLTLSLVANLLTLAVSLFTMVVYNLVIPSGAVGTLEALTLGALFAATAAWGLRVARAGVLARLSAWVGTRIGGAVMRKTLGLPLDLSARLGVENNLVRIRSMEGVRQFIGGSGGASLIDYPFIAVVLLVIALLGGWIVFIPLAGLLLFAALSWPLSRFVEARANQVGRLSRVQQELFTTVVRRLRALRGVGGSVFWRRRLAEMVAQQAEANRDFALANALVQSVGSAIGMLTVLGTMGVGILLVLDGGMSTGGLIATMMLIWRVTAPAQQAFAARVQWRQIADSARQLDRLMQTAGEQQDPQAVSPMAGLAPALAADRAYYRFSADAEAALAGVSFAVEPSRMLAVVGPNGAGKTTLLECLAGIRAPQSGMITVGGRDIRQFDPADYRSWAGYLPQGIQALPLTVGETMRLRVPTASDAEILAALERAGGGRWWGFLTAASAEAGLAARIDPWSEDRDAVRVRFIVKLASATLGDPPLIILDDPLGDVDPQLEGHFQALLAALRGRSTIVMATHRPDLIQQADFVAILNNGALAHFGPVGAPKTEETQGSAA